MENLKKSALAEYMMEVIEEMILDGISKDSIDIKEVAIEANRRMFQTICDNDKMQRAKEVIFESVYTKLTA